jgi:hypothetical protein
MAEAETVGMDRRGIAAMDLPGIVAMAVAQEEIGVTAGRVEDLGLMDVVDRVNLNLDRSLRRKESTSQ